MLGSMLRDPKLFSNPPDFNPQHFLDEKGQFKRTDAFVPFFIGKRYCFGEGLASMELFLFLTTIMQNFHFKSPQSPQDIDVSPKHVGFVTIPQNYTMSFLPRGHGFEPWSGKIAHAVEQLSPCATTTEPVL
ncbi:cytochrome P450 2A13-like isoform X1 [Delphinus delphis]|uniref:cytochrome P450 2A13-like isoform X1 n=1 Tax=Delphinus delphis TaxID=9728 RepID=UPI0028C413DE|nr:cytochrome P450 2A13-like isoform X1 [Delphinus delphis]XP_059856803.1 cytochrome P450 2A13-like isoform X1 [Delphinus delphis]